MVKANLWDLFFEFDDEPEHFPPDLSAAPDSALEELRNVLKYVLSSLNFQFAIRKEQAASGEEPLATYRAWRRKAKSKLASVSLRLKRVREEVRRREALKPRPKKADFYASVARLARALASWTDAPEQVRGAAAFLVSDLKPPQPSLRNRACGL